MIINQAESVCGGREGAKGMIKINSRRGNPTERGAENFWPALKTYCSDGGPGPHQRLARPDVDATLTTTVDR